MAYLTPASIEWLNQHLAAAHPFCHLIVLPHTSIEGNTIRGVRISAGTATDRNGILLIAGVHARELVNPDMLLTFGFQVCQAYKNNTSLTYGGKTYSASLVKLFMENADIFLLPLVNPDGRAYVQSPTGDAWWRKNRNPNPGVPCQGVDLNRGYDFLWSSGIGTSSNSCSEIYKGTASFSEPEIQNVKYLLDTNNNINCFVDVHSYSELILYPWGDDQNQTTNPSMNFLNSIYSGSRGTVGDTAYMEYIPSDDQNTYVSIATNVRDDIEAVRGRVYTAQQSVGLYPTSGTSEDYVFARHFVSGLKRKVYAFTMETGTEFQPAPSERKEVIKDGSAGLATFCLRCACLPKTITSGSSLARTLELARLRELRDDVLLGTSLGQHYAGLVAVDGEIVDLLMADDALRKRVVDIVPQLRAIAHVSEWDPPRTFQPELVNEIDAILGDLAGRADTKVQENLNKLREELRHFNGKTLEDASQEVSRARGGQRT